MSKLSAEYDIYPIQNFSIISICESTENKNGNKVDIFCWCCYYVVFKLFAQNIRFLINLYIYLCICLWLGVCLRLFSVHGTRHHYKYKWCARFTPCSPFVSIYFLFLNRIEPHWTESFRYLFLLLWHSCKLSLWNFKTELWKMHRHCELRRYTQLVCSIRGFIRSGNQ